MHDRVREAMSIELLIVDGNAEMRQMIRAAVRDPRVDVLDVWRLLDKG